MNLNAQLFTGAPVYVGEAFNCGYSFTWATAAACAYRSAVGQNCNVTSPTTGLLVNLNPLAAREWVVPGFHGETYTLRPCAPLSSKCAGRDSGVCEKGLSVGDGSFGLPNSTLTISNDVVTMSFQNGSPCPTTPGYARNSIITFFCDCTGDTSAVPSLTSNPLAYCVATFKWPTPLVCTPAQLAQCPSTTSQVTFTTTTKAIYTTAKPSKHSASSSAKTTEAVVGGILGALVLIVVLFFVYKKFLADKMPSLSIRSHGQTTDLKMDRTDDKDALFNVDEDENL